ncbi:MAG TPA: sugar ABC transporter ATP-binding protein [Jatrophihabitans sp.]|nr:sugar ABC transporter ATP-binding protein [Jatrophihabitans sp.]
MTTTTTETAEPAQGEMPSPMLTMHDIHHAYGKTVALHDLSFEMLPGEIRGLIGENGSGKSTLVKLLSGVMPASSGTIAVDGRRVVFRSPRAAQRAGIVTVFQETLISAESSVRDNVFLGQDGIARRGASRSAERERALEYFEKFGLETSVLDGSVVHLSLAQRQVLTIIRALTRQWRLLILDESTSALDLQTRDALFDVLREQTRSGRSVLFVSHRMDELQSFVDRATVLRSGAMVGTLEQAAATPDALLRLMSQRASKESLENLDELSHKPDAGASVPGGEEAAGERRVESVRIRADVSLRENSRRFLIEVRAGEVLGVAGLEGHGGAAFLETLVGLRPPASGEVVCVKPDLSTKPVRSYGRAVKDGTVYVPGNRQVEGLFAPLSVVDNMLMATMGEDTTLGCFRMRRLLARTQSLVERLDVEVADIRAPVDRLSGGNQQKVLVGRWLAAQPRVLVMNDPLRGVDIGTKRQFYQLLRRLADSDVAVVLLSTEIEELVQVCDRVAVFRDQSVQALLDRHQMGYDEILEAMFGQNVVAGAAQGGAS